jgi:hypothetical protein
MAETSCYQASQQNHAACNSRRPFLVVSASLSATHFPASCAFTLSPLPDVKEKLAESYWKLMVTVTWTVWPEVTVIGAP